MDIEEVDMIDTEPRKRSVEFRFEMFGAVVECPCAGFRVFVMAALVAC